MAPNPVQYAEETLGVHSVWVQAQERFSQYELALKERAKLQIGLRKNRAQLADREAVILNEGRAKYAEISATAFDKVFKTLVHDDASHKQLRLYEREFQSDLDLVDADISAHEIQLKLLAGRLHELGGLLNFYAATKSASRKS